MVRIQCAMVVAILSLLAMPVSAVEPTPFERFVDEYYTAAFAWEPVQATYAGIHEYDDKLADLSKGSIARRIATLKKQQAVLKALIAGKLVGMETIDSTILNNAIRVAARNIFLGIR